MIRFLPLLLFLLPLAIFVVWYVLARRKERLLESGRLPHWQEAPWTWMVVAGLGGAILAFVFIALVPQGEPWRPYVPPVYEDGRIVPGHVDD